MLSIQGHKELAAEAAAGLAGTKCKQGEHTEALSLVEEVLDYLAKGPIEGADEPIRIYLTCFHVLQNCGDGRAGDVLRQAYNRLMVIAGKIFDPATRATFLGRVTAQRELTRLWEAREG